MQRWQSLPYPIFRRLALYAATERLGSDVETGLKILLDDERPALWDNNIRREMLRFLRKRGQHFSEEQLTCLIEAVLKGPPRQMKREESVEREVVCPA